MPPPGLRLSIVVPTLNEQVQIQTLIPHLRQAAAWVPVEIIVSDAGSEDDTVERAEALGARVFRSPWPGRAAQMNFGAEQAKSAVLHFVHADCRPQHGFAEAILKAVASGRLAGSLRNRFQTRHPGLRLCSYLSRFRGLMFRGGGQTLFAQKALFESVGGYDTGLELMEEYELIGKLSRRTRFTVLPLDSVVSVRKHRINGAMRLQLIYACIMGMYFAGASQDRLKRFHRRWVRSGRQAMAFEKPEAF
jgi:rSAM/selenodomain-associated transferase 2